MSEPTATTIAYDLTAIALSVAKVRRRIAYEMSDREKAAKICANLDEFAEWAEDEAERRR